MAFVLILPNQEETNKFEMLLLRKIDHCFDYFDNSDTLMWILLWNCGKDDEYIVKNKGENLKKLTFLAIRYSH